jgi:hypothetical protein
VGMVKNGGHLLMWNQVGKSTSLPTISRPTKPRPSKLFLSEHPHVHLHFTPTYSSWLNPDRNLVLENPARTSLRAASSNPRQISPGKSCVTSATTTKRRSLSDGATKIPPTEYDELFTFICYAALAKAIDASQSSRATVRCYSKRQLRVADAGPCSLASSKEKTDIIRHSP